MVVTAKDIAKKAGVTQPAVSMALNGSRRISEKTRKKILAIAKKLDYHPNASASRLRRQKTMVVGMLIVSHNGGPLFSQRYYSEMLDTLARPSTQPVTMCF